MPTTVLREPASNSRVPTTVLREPASNSEVPTTVLRGGKGGDGRTRKGNAAGGQWPIASCAILMMTRTMATAR